ncbi:MAG: serine hydrolase domain-containing protein [Kineosporiaceae bacterium]
MPDPFALLDLWDVPHVAAAIVPRDGQTLTHGDVRRVFRTASVGKLVAGYAIMVGVEEGAVSLDDPAGPPGATLRHLLAHTSGYGFDSDAGAVAAPGTRRIYSNRGIEEAASHLERAAGLPFAQYLAEAVLHPLGMSDTGLPGSPAHSLRGTAADLARFLRELHQPMVLAPETVTEMRSVQFPGLRGVLPNVGRFDPLDWGLTFEHAFGRPGHWAGTSPSKDTVGHFGGAGTFLWDDPAAGVGVVVLTDRDFGPWALEVWPAFADAVLGVAPAEGPRG